MERELLVTGIGGQGVQLAAQVLEEAFLLAVSLGQATGRAWCLAARADLEVRRGDARAATNGRCDRAKS